MPNKNLVILVGHLGGDPEVKYASSGTAVANFSLATSWGKKKPDGGWDNFTDWHKIVCFGGVAERAADSLSKGMAAMIEGSIRYESWEDDQGVKKYMTKIIANRVDSLAPGSGGGSSADHEAEKYHDPESVDRKKMAQKVREKAAAAAQENEQEEEDDLPF